jgi:PA14 domain-containing protein
VKKTCKGILIVGAMLTLFCCIESWAGVRGRALLIDGADRGKPGDLILCHIHGEGRKLEVLVKGKVVDARFSPDGKQVVYGLDKMIKIMDLKTRASRDLCAFTATFTYFNWTLDNNIYWSDGAKAQEIVRVDIKTGKKETVHKGNRGRTTVSLDGKKASWVIPPVCAFIGGKQYGYMGGCGGAVSPSGKYLTSNLTTSHKLMGILTFGENGPSEKPITVVVGPANYAINGFFFGRSDDWVCYVVEGPKNISPTSYICYWRTGDHIRVAEFGKYCIKDFFDESDVLPANAELEKIVVCSEGPTDTPLTHETINAGAARRLKVVGCYKAGGKLFTPQIRDGVTWKVDAAKLAMTSSTVKGVAQSGRVTVAAQYKGQQDSFDVTVLPKLTGDGFKAEYFSDATFTKPALTRIDPYIDFRWMGRSSPDKAINGRKAWSARWTGTLDVQVAGKYTFYFMQGEGNDGWIKDANGKRVCRYGVWVDGKLMISRTRNWNYPWALPKPSQPIMLTKGRHSIKVVNIDKSSHPVVAQLYWSGPVIKKSLLGDGYVHSKK